MMPLAVSPVDRRHRARPSGGYRRVWQRLALTGAGVCLGATASWPDVPVDHWARPGVLAMAARGLVVGRADGRFDGNGGLTRYEMVALLGRALPLRPFVPDDGAGRPSSAIWQDLPARHWAAPSVTFVVGERRLLSSWPGLGGGYFSGDKPATRDELAVALATLLPPDLPGESRERAPAWAAAARSRVMACGVLVGFPDGRFHGERPVSRYEAILAFHKALAFPWPGPVVEAPATPASLALKAPAPAPPQAEAPGLPPLPPANLPRLALSFLPEYLSEMTEASRGEATGWAMASTGLQGDWADGPLLVSGSWRIAQYGLRQVSGSLQSRLDQQVMAGAGYRWRFGTGRHDGEIGLLGLGTFLGRRAGGTGDDLLGMDLQAFGIGMGVQLRWPVAYRLVAQARTDVVPLLGAQFGPGVSGQLGLVQASVGLDWYLDRLSLGLGYRLRHLYDGQQRFSHWANGLQIKAALAF
jgi:hypothetical protein